MELFRTNYKNPDIKKFVRVLSPYINENNLIVCIGTDKCIGDCLAPLVGTLLMDKGYDYPLYGTLKYPVHAVNIKDKLKEIRNKYPNKFIIAIDASVGEESRIGEIVVSDTPIHPGKGVGKVLPDVGNISIMGITSDKDKADAFFTGIVRLDMMMDMAKIITSVIMQSKEQSFKKDIACCI